MSRIVRDSTRAVFSELVRRAIGDQEAVLSPMAVTYLVELLEAQVRPEAATPHGGCDESTLAEALLRANVAEGLLRAARLRELGDRTLFVSGFFGDSLRRRGVGIDYYREIGCAAYAGVATCLPGRGAEPGWPALFRELADHFAAVAELLGDVGDRARDGTCDLLRIYASYLGTASARDRRRLLRRGVILPDPGDPELPQ